MQRVQIVFVPGTAWNGNSKKCHYVLFPMSKRCGIRVSLTLFVGSRSIKDVPRSLDYEWFVLQRARIRKLYTKGPWLIRAFFDYARDLSLNVCRKKNFSEHLLV